MGKFEKSLIEIENSNDFDKDFIKNLSKKLFEWTNFRWIITMSQSKGNPTHSQVKSEQKKDKLEIIKKSEKYKKMIDVFPDAELIQIEEEN